MAKQASKLKGYNNVFAVRLRQLMQERNITQDILAEKANCSRQSISQYMDGSSVPNVDKLLSIAEYFRVSVDYLLGLASEPTTDKDVNFVCEYTGLCLKSVEDLNEGISRLLNDNVDFLLSDASNNGYYEFCFNLVNYKTQYYKFLEYKEKILNDKNMFPKNNNEAENIVKNCDQLSDEKDLLEFKLKKSFDKIINSFCESEIRRDNEISSDYQKTYNYIKYDYAIDFFMQDIDTPEKLEQAVAIFRQGNFDYISDIKKGNIDIGIIYKGGADNGNNRKEE